MSILIISDTHFFNIQDQEPYFKMGNREIFFIEWLKAQEKKHSKLLILGDFFDHWFGDYMIKGSYKKAFTPMLDALKNSTMPIDFIRGNRDTLISKQFARATGATLREPPFVLETPKNRILFCHGDEILKDKGHRFLRKILTSVILQKFGELQLNNRIFSFWLKIWNSGKKASKGRVRRTNYQQIPYDDNLIQKWLKKHQADLLIHGHFHRWNISDTNPIQSINSWDTSANWITIDDSGHIESHTQNYFL